MSTIMPAFDRYQQEASIIGRLLVGYGELEFDLCLCIAQGSSDFDTTLKAMFRTRGETQRIDIADALGRRHFAKLKLVDRFSEAVADMRYCLQIRNRFAHCNWHDDANGQLGFVNLEEIAKEHKPALLDGLTIRYLNVSLLAEQEAYFRYVSRCLAFLNFEAQRRHGRIRSHAWTVLKKLQRPPAYICGAADDD
jgi:hypothetical protein